MNIDSSLRCLKCGVGPIESNVSFERFGSAKVKMTLRELCPECGEKSEYHSYMTKNFE